MLKSIELSGFKSFAKKTQLDFKHPVSAIVGPNGSGKSHCAEAFRFVLGEQSMKSMRGKKNEDLIFNGSRSEPRSNRAGVRIVFDNSNRLLDMDFDEIVLERVVHRDGTNTYSVNGTPVRLKDITELLAGANIGSSGHHIISQGEADRVLSVSPKERKTMIEDALGLKKYLYKKKESERKLEKTDSNIAEAEGLRRELKPQLRYLKKQVDTIEHIKQLKDELISGFRDYLAHEDHYLKHTSKLLQDQTIEPLRKKSELEKELREAHAHVGESKKEDPFVHQIHEVEGQEKEHKQTLDELVREIGRIEGEIKAEERLLIREKERATGEHLVSVPRDLIETFKSEIHTFAERGRGLFDISMLKELIETIKNHATDFFANFDTKATSAIDSDEILRSIETLNSTKETLNTRLSELQQEIELVGSQKQELLSAQKEHNEAFHAAEKRVLEISSELRDINNELEKIELQRSSLTQDNAVFEEDMKEAGFLFGNSVLRFEEISLQERTREEQRSVRKNLERKKMKYEDDTITSYQEVIKEYESLLERDTFLASQIADLTQTKGSLIDMIAQLKNKLETEFHEGVSRINEKFGKFFKLMFGSGSAELSVSRHETKGDEDEEKKVSHGLEVGVSLPHKKIRGLEMLSGGERALTSIALLFAISQLNPPPFIILDETDAALDEANSRKYGDMIEGLARHSQLVVITHNRETMSRAGLLYGVTMGGNGVSKILTVEFDDALSVAK